MADLGWSKHIEVEEDKAIEACISTAMRNGHTLGEAGSIIKGMEYSEATAFRGLVRKWLSLNPMQFGLESTLAVACYRALVGELDE
jgi:hypothetical protein